MATESLFLKCGACGHDNEPERVYCHNCGQKLDRSLLPPPEARKEHEGDADKHKRVKKMMKIGAGGNWVVRDLKTAAKILVFAAIVAALFLFWQKPDGLPTGKTDDLPRNVGDAWKDLMTERDGQKHAFSEVEVNYFLKNTIKSSDGSVPGVKFERAMVTFTAGPDGAPGAMTVTTQRDAWGMPLYSSMTFAPRDRDGKVEWEVIGVRFGRLGIHPSLKILGEWSMGGVKKAFEKEIGQSGRLKSVLPGKEVILLETNPMP